MALDEEGLVAVYESDRKIKSCPPPAWVNLTKEKAYVDGTLDPLLVLEHFRRMGILDDKLAVSLLESSSDLMRKEPNCLLLDSPFVVVGDIHGQFYDLITILEKMGLPPTRRYLFLGDYVDRGGFGCECVLFLSALKIRYPEHVYFLRGNHECRKLASHFNFELESTTKYSQNIFERFMDWMDTLPLSAVVQSSKGKFFCTHGGPPSTIVKEDEFQKIDRFREPGTEGVVADCLWSDPLPEETADGLGEDDMEEWYSVDFEPNPDRGCGMMFGYQGLNRFLQANDYVSIVRGHEVKPKGFEANRFCRKIEERPFPMLMTIFSAPNYCDMYGNLGSVLCIEEEEKKGDDDCGDAGEKGEKNPGGDLGSPSISDGDEGDDEDDIMGPYRIISFRETAHPFVLPKSQNGITLSLPHIITHCSGLVDCLTTLEPEEEKEEEPAKPVPQEIPRLDEEKLAKRAAIRRKILAYTRMNSMFNVLREADEDLKVIRSHNEGVLPKGILSARRQEIAEAAERFRKAKQEDAVNERLPGSEKSLAKPATVSKLTKFFENLHAKK